jgi:DNA repair protein RecO (recombination protein O)
VSFLIETAAIVLRTIDYGEADRVVTLLGRTSGCVSAIARGARKSQRRFGGGLGLCAVGTAAIRERAGSDLFTLERFDVTASHPSLSLEVLRVAEVAYAAELVTKLCAPRQPEPAIFDALAELLGRVDSEGASSARLRVFELVLLDRLGFAPVLDACAVCGRDDLSRGDAIDVRWNPARGGVVCRACGSLGRPMRPIVRLALCRYAGLPLGAVEVPGGAPPLAPDVAQGCRDALGELVASHLSAPLRSLEFLAKLEAPIRADGHRTDG